MPGMKPATSWSVVRHADPINKNNTYVNMNNWTFSGNSYNSEERLVCAGYDNGDIKMFDLKTMSVRWETNVKNGVSILYYISDH